MASATRLTMDATLPSYDEHQAPAYVARHQHIEHTFPLKPNSCNAWATLKLNSAASSPWSEPLYTDGDSITGSLEIDLQKKEHMEQIDIRVPISAISTRVWANTLTDNGTNNSTDDETQDNTTV